MLRRLLRASGKFTLAFTALAALCLTTSASAQQTLSCTALPVDNPALRDNGVAERIGDIKIICTGGTPTAFGAPVPRFNLQVFTSPGANITSRLLGGDVSEALLLFDEPAPAAQSICGAVSTPADSTPAGTCTPLGTGNGIGTYSGAPKNGAAPGRPNAFAGRWAGPTSIVFSNIPFDPPGQSGVRTLRLTNIRVNASQLNNVRGNATALSLIISTTSSGTGNSIQIPIGNQAPTVGIAQTAMDFSVSAATFLQCESQNYSGGSLASPLTPQLSLKFTERFNSAFRRRSAAIPVSSDAVPAPGESNVFDSAVLFESESGFYKFSNGSNWNLNQLGLSAPASLDKAGLADSGTRLLARFKNLPQGVALYAANHGQLFPVSNPNAAATGDVHATAATPNGEGAFSSAGPTEAFSQTPPGNATVAWEVIKTNTNVTESVTIPIAVAYLSADGSRPRAGAVGADGQLAPMSTSAIASTTAAIPRFVEDTANDNRQLFTISVGPCAPPPGPPVTLALSVNPPGAGAILGSSSIICASNCFPVFDPASPPTFSAAPSPGFVFTGWSGACSGIGPCAPFLDGTPLIANFLNSLSGTLTLGVKGGPPNARIWPLAFTGTYQIFSIYSFGLTQTVGAACSPVLAQQPGFFYQGGFTIPLAIDFTGCAANARFRLTVPYSVNNNNLTLIVNNQFQ